jgi:predicted acyltransferase
MTEGSTASSRLVALDAFRGLTIAFMVLVNDAGDGAHTYWPLQHARWDGWTPTDVVFPSFVWIVGVAITLSLSKKLAAGVTRGALLGHAFRRALILFVLGLVVYMAPRFDPATQRLLGVLQRIAICFLAAVAIYVTTKVRGQIIWLIGILAGYWALMAFAPVPGYGAGRLDVEGNFAHYIDRIVLGAHNYHSTRTWDPEGIVSTLPAIATALFGILCGQLLRVEQWCLRDKILRMFLLGGALMAAAYLCNIWLPINKKLWTSSFSIFMAGLDFVLLAGFLFAVDVKGYQRMVKPLVIMGLNPITIYMLSELLSEALDFSKLHDVIYLAVFVPIASPYNASLLWALTYTGLMYAAAWGMYRKSWVVRA